GCVAQPVDETGVRDTDKGLLAAPAQVGFVLPERVLANHQCTDTLSHQQVDDAARGGVQVVLDLPCAVGRQSIAVCRRTRVPRGVWSLRPALVVALVARLDRATVDNAGHEARLV